MSVCVVTKDFLSLQNSSPADQWPSLVAELDSRSHIIKLKGIPWWSSG